MGGRGGLCGREAGPQGQRLRGLLKSTGIFSFEVLSRFDDSRDFF